MPSGAQSGTDAAELFSRANAARRSGSPEAMRLYQQLLQRYPRSAEATTAQVVLGRMLLGSRPEQALQHYRAYLAAQPSGALAQEALYGTARCLQRLGRSGEERAAWRKLLERYPKSFYAKMARERLGMEH